MRFGVACPSCPSGIVWHEGGLDSEDGTYSRPRRTATCKCHGLPPFVLDADTATMPFADSRELAREMCGGID